MKILDKKAITKIQTAILATVLIVVAVAGAAAYYLTLPPPKIEIVFGCAISLSGSNANQGAQVLRGYKLWVKDINQNGGLLGKTVRLIYYDDTSTPTTTQTLYEKLITSDKVDFLVGPYYSACGQTAAVVAEKYHMVMIHAMNNARILYNQTGYNYEFLTHSNGVADFQYDQLFQLLITLPSDTMPKTVAIVNTASAYPRSVVGGVNYLISKYASHGFTIVYQEEVPVGVTDLTATVSKVKNTGAQILFATGDFNSEVLLIRTASDFNYHPQVVVTSTAAGMIDNFRNALNQSAIGCLYLSGYTSQMNLTAAKTYANEFKAEYGTEATSYDGLGYRACQVLAAAISSTGSLNQDTVRDWLTTHTVDTNCGPWRVDQNLLAQGVKYVPVETAVMMQHQDQGFVVIYPTDVATAQFLFPRP